MTRDMGSPGFSPGLAELPGTPGGMSGLVAEYGHHAALGRVIEVVAVGHPLPGVVRIEVAGDLLAGQDEGGLYGSGSHWTALPRGPDVHRDVFSLVKPEEMPYLAFSRVKG